MTAPSLGDLAGAALALVAREGVRVDDAAGTGEPGWWLVADAPDGSSVEISLAGPDIPGAVDEDIAPPVLIAEQLGWKGSHRLVVTPRQIAFDIYWTPGEPVRIMTFSRGDWEKALLELAS